MPKHIAEEFLPDELPTNPMETVAQWLAAARAAANQPNSNAMTLATADPEGRPSARIVLCKHFDADAGTIDFYTNYQSRKGGEIANNSFVAVVFHWDHQGRQVRIEGQIEKLSGENSDAYFASRPRDSQIGAWASDQSQPVPDRKTLIEKFASNQERFDDASASIPRPPHWGGYRIHAAACELWVEGSGRVHDRARFVRTLDASAGYESGRWMGQRLQP
ncbi:MAG: pyridoxamine 5'-phosphate oxidase [Pseudomonadota bacterium]